MFIVRKFILHIGIYGLIFKVFSNYKKIFLIIVISNNPIHVILNWFFSCYTRFRLRFTNIDTNFSVHALHPNASNILIVRLNDGVYVHRITNVKLFTHNSFMLFRIGETHRHRHTLCMVKMLCKLLTLDLTDICLAIRGFSPDMLVLSCNIPINCNNAVHKLYVNGWNARILSYLDGSYYKLTSIRS